MPFGSPAISREASFSWTRGGQRSFNKHRRQGWALIYPCCFPGLKGQTALLIFRLSNIYYRLGVFVLSGLWLRRQLATRCKKILEKCLRCFCLILLFLPTNPYWSLLERGHWPGWVYGQPNWKKKPRMFKLYLLLTQSSNSSIINLLLGARNTPGSLVCKYFAKTVVMKLTISVSRRLEILHKAAYVQKYSRWKRNQTKSTATANISVPRTLIIFFFFPTNNLTSRTNLA